MKKELSILIIAGLISAPATAKVRKPHPTDTPKQMMEKLDRGLIVIPMTANGQGNTYFASWRYLGTDDTGTTFTLLKNGRPYSDATTNMTDATSAEVKGSSSDTWQVVTLQDGDSIAVSESVHPWDKPYLPLKLNRPTGGTVDGRDYVYVPGDCSCGDVDGDGKYELFVKWDPTNAKDNSFSGGTGNVYIDCYRLDGTQLWRVDLGANIRAGAHYTQFLVYDFNGDGRAEMICKTATGSVDGTGKYVNQAATDAEIRRQDNSIDYRVFNGEGKTPGRILEGPEYLTVFNGLTGAAIHTIYYNPNRAGGMNAVGKNPDKSFWGDNYGNRSERYLAAVAWLGGPDENPSAVMCRGYYTKSYLWAVDFDGSRLKTRWLHASISKTQVQVYDSTLTKKKTYDYHSNTFGVSIGSELNDDEYTAWGQGAHSLSVGDINFDGRDEIIYGSAAIDADGKLLYSTGLGHGDAQHLGDFDPDRPGFEYFMVLENKPYGYNLRDALTGEKILYGTSWDDTGRGLMADVDSAYRGAEFIYLGARGAFDIKGHQIVDDRYDRRKTMSMNFRIFWDGDPYEELLDGTRITKFSAKNGHRIFHVAGSTDGRLPNLSSCNGTKKTPCLSADLFGDWREEVIWWDKTNASTLYIVSTTEPTPWRVPTLMHDRTYRLGVARENTSYNQPPHLGYYLPDFIATFRGKKGAPAK